MHDFQLQFDFVSSVWQTIVDKGGEKLMAAAILSAKALIWDSGSGNFRESWVLDNYNV